MQTHTSVKYTHFRYGLNSVRTGGDMNQPHTDDKINPRAEVEFQELVAHELVHFDIFDDAVFSYSL